MDDYSYLSVSDGSGDAALMHVMATRLAAATTIVVDSVTNVPAKFIASYGNLLPSGFIDPATLRTFRGHLSGADLIIDAFAPGSSDGGNTAGQVVVIRPNTAWADAMVALARVAHNDDGTIKAALLEASWPVGSIHISTSNADPSTTLGFGTWAAYAAGKVLVGKAPSGTFASAGSTGGAETQNLAHNHATDAQGAHSHSGTTSNGNYNGGASNVLTQSSSFSPPGHNHTFGTDVQGSHGHNITSSLGATSVLQPYVVVYMWTRTA